MDLSLAPIPKWTHARFARGIERLVPRRPGLYAIVTVGRTLGLPTKVTVHYVGKTLSLRRRFLEHLHEREPNNGLYGLARRLERRDLEFWHANVPAERLSELEVHMIQEIRPAVNRRLYAGVAGGRRDLPIRENNTSKLLGENDND